MPVQKITKEEILIKSADVFRVKGYHNTSMQDLAEACGLLKGSLYYHFPSKEMLMKDLLVSIHEFMTTQIFPIAKDETLTPEERMEKLLKKMGKLTLEREGGCLVGNTTLETVGVVSEFKEVLQTIMNDWTSALKDIFITRKSTEQSIRLAQLTIMEFEGAIMFSKLYNDKQFLYDAFARTMMKLN
jgi:TetR/AcrR family transcriptional repressor of nem operon